jgi:PEP-CTERM motif-containing protein
VFTKISDATALGGQAIKSPNGSIVSDPASQETVATYSLTFQTPGTYTAYYKMRGFSSSTDSIYVPDAFATDPDNQLTTGQTGAYAWKKDTHTFTISAPNTNVPLELRLGMREQQSEIDAIVLNLSSSLTNAQLDNLFAVLPGDYNGDNIVDARDYLVWRDTLGSTTSLAADGDGDHVIGAGDYAVWLNHFGTSMGSGGFGSDPVPEPATIQLFALALTAGAAGFRRNATSIVHSRYLEGAKS